MAMRRRWCHGGARVALTSGTAAVLPGRGALIQSGQYGRNTGGAVAELPPALRRAAASTASTTRPRILNCFMNNSMHNWREAAAERELDDHLQAGLHRQPIAFRLGHSQARLIRITGARRR